MQIKFKLPKGRWTPLEVGSRLELNKMRSGVLKEAQIKLVEPEVPNTELQNKPMQNICGL